MAGRAPEGTCACYRESTKKKGVYLWSQSSEWDLKGLKESKYDVCLL